MEDLFFISNNPVALFCDINRVWNNDQSKTIFYTSACATVSCYYYAI